MATHYQFCSLLTVKYEMIKSTDYIGQPIFSQLLSLLDQSIIKLSMQSQVYDIYFLRITI